MREQIINNLKEFYSELTETDSKFRAIEKEYKNIECAGNYSKGVQSTIFIKVKGREYTAVLGSLFDEKGNKVRFDYLMKELEK